MILGRGSLDYCADVEGRGIVGGYYQTLSGEPVLQCEVRVGGQPVHVLGVVEHLASPDVAALPHGAALRGAADCRFYVHTTQLFADVPPHTLVELRPSTAGGAAMGLRTVYRPTSPRPDEAAIASIGGGYEGPAYEFLNYMIDLGGLRPEHRMLDLGCGIGRMALGLSAWLRGGSYLGLDVMRPAIDVAQAGFAAFPDFEFRHIDVHNGHYNPGGRLRATEVQLRDLAGGPFDFVLMTSLLTHLLPADLEHYLAQVASVLASGGRALATAWVVTPRAAAGVRAGRSEIAFVDRGGYWTEVADNPEGAIAHEHAFLVAAIERAGLRLERMVEGFWAGDLDRLAYQDLLVLTRR